MQLVELDPVFAVFAGAIAFCLAVIGAGTAIDHRRARRQRRYEMYPHDRRDPP